MQVAVTPSSLPVVTDIEPRIYKPERNHIGSGRPRNKPYYAKYQVSYVSSANKTF